MYACQSCSQHLENGSLQTFRRDHKRLGLNAPPVCMLENNKSQLVANLCFSPHSYHAMPALSPCNPPCGTHKAALNPLPRVLRFRFSRQKVEDVLKFTMNSGPAACAAAASVQANSMHRATFRDRVIAQYKTRAPDLHKKLQMIGCGEPRRTAHTARGLQSVRVTTLFRENPRPVLPWACNAGAKDRLLRRLRRKLNDIGEQRVLLDAYRPLARQRQCVAMDMWPSREAG